MKDETSEHNCFNQTTGFCVIRTSLTGHDLGTFCFSIDFVNISLSNTISQQLPGGMVKGIFVYTSPSFLKISNAHWKEKDIQELSFNPLNTKRRPLYLKTQFVPRSKHFSSRL